jgi:hypothetical protein
VRGDRIGFVVGSVVHDFRPEVDPDAWARKWGLLGGLAGLLAFVERL